MAKQAYSYLRFSSAEQADGDSVRRQTELTDAWCKRNGYTLNASTSYADKGVSGFKGKHRSNGALASFLADVESKRVPSGSVLIVENLDRISREGLIESVPLLCSLLKAGITIVTLSPSEMRYEPSGDQTKLIIAVLELGRGHSESAMKSERIGAAWNEKKRLARERGDIVTKRLPLWIEVKDGKLVLNAERARVVRRIFRMATEGEGVRLIVKRLTNDRVETFGKCPWTRAYVQKILTRNVAIGVYQPKKSGKPDGEPIQGYFPAVIDQQTYERVQAMMSLRKDGPGRVGVKVASLFTGLLRDAKTGANMQIALQTRSIKNKTPQRKRMLVSTASIEGRIPYTSFPYQLFEEALLCGLKEIDPVEIVGTEQGSKATELAMDLAAVEQRLRTLEQNLVGDGDVPTLLAAVRTLEGKRRELTEQLAIERAKEACPQQDVWRETQGVLSLAKQEKYRLRIRSLLRQLVREIVVLVVPHATKKSVRSAMVQIYFANGERRSMEITYKAAGNGRGAYENFTAWYTSDDADLMDAKVIAATEARLASKTIPTMEERIKDAIAD